MTDPTEIPTPEATTEAEPETSGAITVTLTPEAAKKIKADLEANPIGTIVAVDPPEHTATGPGESVVDPGNGGRCW